MAPPPDVRIADEPAFRIGTVEVRPAAREIRVDARRVVLEPRTMQVLILLARRPGEVVSRQALIDGCWGGRVVGEDAVNRALLKLRRVMREVEARDLTIETVPRVGYRLSAGPGAGGAAPPAADRRFWLAGAFAVAAAVGGGALAWSSFGPRPKRSAAAQDLYVRGKAAFQRGAPEDNAEAVTYFRRIVAADPQDAEAWAALALALRFEQSFVAPSQTAQAQARAEGALRRAQALDAALPDAIAAQALYLPFRGHWLESERRMVEGLRRDPRIGVLNGFYGMLLAAVGRTDRACTFFETSLASESFVPLLRADYAGVLWSAGRVRQADRILDDAAATWPRYAELWWTRVWIYTFTRRTEAAAALLARSPPAEIKSSALQALQRAFLALGGGGPVEIAAALQTMREAAALGEMGPSDAASLCAALGDADGAFAFARQALVSLITPDARRPVQPTFLFRPPMARLSRDPRYVALLHDIGLFDYWARSGTAPDARYAIAARPPALASRRQSASA